MNEFGEAFDASEDSSAIWQRPKDVVTVEWLPSFTAEKEFDVVFICADKYSSILADSFLSSNSSEDVGFIRLKSRAGSRKVGHLKRIINQRWLFIHFTINALEEVAFEFLPEVITAGVTKEVFVLRKQHFVGHSEDDEPTPLALKVCTQQSGTPGYIGDLFSFDIVPVGSYLENLLASVLNHCHTLTIPAVAILFRLDRDDLQTTATLLDQITAKLSERYAVSITSPLDKSIFEAWRKLVAVDEINHLYL